MISLTRGVSICLDCVLIKSLDVDIIKECISTVKKSWSRSRLLNFVSTSISRPKSLNQDWKIHRDLKILAFLDSLSRSRLRSAWIFAFSHQDFSIRWDFSSFSDSKGLNNVKISQQILTASWQISTNLDASWQISTISMCLDNLDKNIDTSKSRLKSLDFKNLNREKNPVLTVEKIFTLQKSWSWHYGQSWSRSWLVSTLRTVSILSLIGLDFGDPQA